MLSFRLENVRAIEKTPTIELRPLTLVVGRNSVGKSSLVRWLPLLAQSQSADSTAPVAWRRRTHSLVDFGSFDETVRRGAAVREIRFAWTTQVDPGSTDARTATVRATLATDPVSSGTYLQSCRVEIGGVAYEFESPGPDGELTLLVNGELVGGTLPALPAPATVQGTLPSLQSPPTQAEIAAVLAAIKYGKADKWRLASIARGLRGWDVPTLHQRTFASPDLTQTWRDHFPPPSDHPTKWQRILNLVALGQASRIVRALRTDLEGTLENLVYVAPFRQEPARSERSPEPSARLDPRGEGLLSFLEGLRPHDRVALSEWIREALGFSIHLKEEGLSRELRVTDANGIEANIADVGYGVGQILPVLLHLWALTRTAPAPTAVRPVVIEQPELHLHPAMQARVGRLLAGVAKPTGPVGPRLLVETHGEAIVSAVGKAIEDGILTERDVQVLMVEQLPGAAATVRVCTFDGKGYLDAATWPYGFFAA